KSLIAYPLSHLNSLQCLARIETVHSPTSGVESGVVCLHIVSCAGSKIIFIQYPQRAAELFNQFGYTNTLDGELGIIAGNTRCKNLGINSSGIGWRFKPVGSKW